MRHSNNIEVLVPRVILDTSVSSSKNLNPEKDLTSTKNVPRSCRKFSISATFMWTKLDAKSEILYQTTPRKSTHMNQHISY